MNYNFSKQERLQNLRETWPHEAHHFTHWVADEGLDLLSQELKLNGIVEPKCEERVGDKQVDIFAKEKKTGRHIIIENQLEATNHDHLGKIVTYAAGKTADIVVWIVAKSTDEYIKAVEWLNRRTDNDIDFYLVEVQIWKIDNTLLIPRFSVIVRPSPKEKYRAYSKSEQWMVDFWTEFNSYASSIPHYFFSPKENFNAPKKAHPENSYDLCVNGYNKLKVTLVVKKTEKLVKAGIYIPNDKNTYSLLSNHKEEIDKLFKSEIVWKEKLPAFIFVTRPFEDFDNMESQNEIFKWLCDTALQWKDIIKTCWQN